MPDRDLSMTTLDYLNSHINMEEINYSELHKFASSMGFPLELLSSHIFVKNFRVEKRSNSNCSAR